MQSKMEVLGGTGLRLEGPTKAGARFIVHS
jgi:hypothetical protein